MVFIFNTTRVQIIMIVSYIFSKDTDITQVQLRILKSYNRYNPGSNYNDCIIHILKRHRYNPGSNHTTDTTRVQIIIIGSYIFSKYTDIKLDIS